MVGAFMTTAEVQIQHIAAVGNPHPPYAYGVRRDDWGYNDIEEKGPWIGGDSHSPIINSAGQKNIIVISHSQN